MSRDKSQPPDEESAAVNDELQAQALSALRSLKGHEPEPSPFLVARISASLRQKKSEAPLQIWLRFFWPALSAGLACALVIVLSQSKSPSEGEYLVGKDYLIRVDIRQVHQTEVAYAEVVLHDEKLKFSSEKFSDVRDLRKLVVEWEQLTEKQYLPIVVQGQSAGASQVTVNFYDKNNRIIMSKEMSLHFKGNSI